MKQAYLYIFLATVIFSTMEIALKLVTGIFNPIQLTFTRFFVGGLFLIPFMISSLHKRKLFVTTRDLAYFAFLGFLGIFVSMLLYQLAVDNTLASVVAVLFSCNPVFVTIFAFIILKEAIHKNNVLALILEVIGTLVIINPLHVKLSVLGVSYTIVAMLIFALYGVFGKRKVVQFGSITVTCFSFLLGSMEMLAVIGLSHIPQLAAWFNDHGLEIFSNIPIFKGYTLAVLPIVAYICIVNSGIGYVCYFSAMEKTSAHTASLAFFFKPMLAPVLCLVILHEIIPFNMVIGILLILAGSLASILPELLKQRKAKKNMEVV
jgi:drug/metabolite transporter (DMT)-like permease